MQKPTHESGGPGQLLPEILSQPVAWLSSNRLVLPGLAAHEDNPASPALGRRQESIQAVQFPVALNKG
jgi:hypothetical protein